MVRHPVPYSDFDSRLAARLAIENASHTLSGWADVGIYALDNRVLWTEEEDSIVLYFRPWEGQES